MKSAREKKSFVMLHSSPIVMIPAIVTWADNFQEFHSAINILFYVTIGEERSITKLFFSCRFHRFIVTFLFRFFFQAPQAYLEINHTRKPERNRVRARDSARSPKRKVKSACSLMLSSIIILAFFPEFISHNFCAVLSFPLNGYSAL